MARHLVRDGDVAQELLWEVRFPRGRYRGEVEDSRAAVDVPPAPQLLRLALERRRRAGELRLDEDRPQPGTRRMTSGSVFCPGQVSSSASAACNSGTGCV